jgi:hypothetical protein
MTRALCRRYVRAFASQCVSALPSCLMSVASLLGLGLSLVCMRVQCES